MTEWLAMMSLSTLLGFLVGRFAPRFQWSTGTVNLLCVCCGLAAYLLVWQVVPRLLRRRRS